MFVVPPYCNPYTKHFVVYVPPLFSGCSKHESINVASLPVKCIYIPQQHMTTENVAVIHHLFHYIFCWENFLGQGFCIPSSKWSNACFSRDNHIVLQKLWIQKWYSPLELQFLYHAPYPPQWHFSIIWVRHLLCTPLSLTPPTRSQYNTHCHHTHSTYS